MSINSSNSSIGGGNTMPPPKKQDSPKTNWCLTLNNYSVEEYNSLKSFFSSNSSNIWIIGKEVGESGTPHLQCFCAFKIKIRFTALKKVCDRLHLEPSRGTKKQNLFYCSKGEQTHQEWEQLKESGPNWGKGAIFESNTRIPKPLKLITDLWPYQKKVEEYILTEPDDRHILLVSGKFSTGKTQIAKYLTAKYNWVVGPLEGKKSHILSNVYHNQDAECFILYLTGVESTKIRDDWECADSIQLFDCLEKIKDGFFMSHFGVKATGSVIMNSPHIVIFSNLSLVDFQGAAEYNGFDKQRIIHISTD